MERFIYACTQMCIYINTHTHGDTYTDTAKLEYMYAHITMCIHAYVYMYIDVQIDVYMYMDLCMQVYMYMYNRVRQ